jgi:hypothetical protein
MTAIPTNKCLLNFEDSFIRESYYKTLQSINHKNIMPHLHLDILLTQNLMIKIVPIHSSLKDLIYKVVN